MSSAQAKLHRGVPMSLRRLPPEHFKVFNDVFVPRLDNDGNTRLHHVILSTFGIFIVQVQPENGLITGAEEDREWNLIQQDGRRRFINPLIRSAYHVKALAKYLEVPEASILPIIFFDAEPRFEAPCPPYMLTQGLGRYIISHTVPLLSQEILDDVYMKFASLTSHRNPEAAMQKHQAARARRLRHTRERAA
ncbi:MAG: nuclease-related domain-containing protein [Verrucomicrobiota bacterium]